VTERPDLNAESAKATVPECDESFADEVMVRFLERLLAEWGTLVGCATGSGDIGHHPGGREFRDREPDQIDVDPQTLQT
jgi:hypothetical protein